MIARQFGNTIFFENDWFDAKSKSTAPVGKPRGKITSFSWASSRRFMDRLSRIDYDRMNQEFGTAGWLTLTYDGKQTGVQDCKKHLDYLLSKVLPRAGFLGPAVWKAELQKRGTIHFHVLYFGLSDDQETRIMIAEKWHAITGSKQKQHLIHGTDLARVRSVDELRCYLSKYVTKGESGQWENGRIWGIYRKPKIIDHEEIIHNSESSFSAVILAFRKVGIHLPSTVYDIHEWITYAEMMFNREPENRCSYYQWRSNEYERNPEQHLDKRTAAESPL